MQQVTAAPKFMSRGQTYRAVIGDTLVLPCEVQDLGMLFKQLLSSNLSLIR